MVGRTSTKRGAQVVEIDQTTSMLDTNVPEAKAFTQMDVQYSDNAAQSSDSLEIAQVDELIRRYLSSCQYKSAVHWADKRLALCKKGNTIPSLIDIAKYLQVLSTVNDWTRIIAYIDNHDLLYKHIFFAYNYVNALFKKKMFSDILKLKIVNLDDENLPSISLAGNVLPIHREKRITINDEEKQFLDSVVNDLKLEAVLFFTVGKAYLLTGNRRSAQVCLRITISNDPAATEAFDLVQKYNLLSKQELDDLLQKSASHVESPSIVSRYYKLLNNYRKIGFDEPTNEPLIYDLSIRTAKAATLYDFGDITGANKITSEILNEVGVYQECLLVHIATLVHLKKCDDLFMLSHRLVESDPDSEITWYTVGCYYYSAFQNRIAKNFLHKCTMMNSSFGEGWIAFGHVLSTESEHEQAMNCYLRASRILEGSFEPLMYIGLEYSLANNVKLALDFIKDAINIAGDNPLALNELGSIYFVKGEYLKADECFWKALRIIHNEMDSNVNLSSLLSRPLNYFWHSLVANFGHTKRKLCNWDEAIKLYQKSLVICPRKASSLCALAICFASIGKVELAVQHFLEALGIAPHDQIAKKGLDKLVEFLENHTKVRIVPILKSPMESTEPELSEELQNVLEDKDIKQRSLFALKGRKAKPNKPSQPKTEPQRILNRRETEESDTTDDEMDFTMS